MVTTLTLFLLYLFALTQVNADIIDCTPSSSPVKIKNLYYYPNPPVIGKPVLVNITATFNRTIQDAPGEILAQMYHHHQWENLFPISFNLCYRFIFKCPIKPGVYNYFNRFIMPSVPDTAYRGQVTVWERSSGEQLTCLMFQFRF
jgi:hypothetical protein